MYKFCRTAEHFPLSLLGLSKPHSRGFQTVNKFLVLEARMEGISHFPVFKLQRVQKGRCAVSAVWTGSNMENAGWWSYTLCVSSLMMRSQVFFFLRPLKCNRFVARLA